MAESVPDILHLLASAVSITKRVNKIIRDVMDKGDLGVVDKGKNDPQTEADRSAQKCIVQSLLRKFPGLTVIGEEELSQTYDVPEDYIVQEEDEEVLSKKYPSKYNDISINDVVVWVDPLDGTREFTTGFLSHVTVLIGIAYGGKPIAGVIHQPYYEENGVAVGRTVWGMKEVGYSGFELKQPPADKMIVTVTRSHSDKELEAALVKLNPDEIVRVGGAGHKVLLVLEGRVHAYIVPSKGLKRWDSCACEAILETVGGMMTDKAGNFYLYDKETNYNIINGIIGTLNEATLNVIIKLLKKL